MKRIQIISNNLKTETMRNEKNERGRSQLRKRMNHFAATLVAIQMLIIAVILPGCTKEDHERSLSGAHSSDADSWKYRTSEKLSVVSVDPVNLSTNVPVTTSLTITVNQELKSWMKSFISVDLKDGTTKISGTISFKDRKVSFKPAVNLKPGIVYSTTFNYGIKNADNDDHDGDNDDHDGDKEDDDDDASATPTYSWSFTTAGGTVVPPVTSDVTAPTISTVVPAGNALSVAASTKLTVTFSEAMNASTINTTTVNLKQGTTAVPGTVAYSNNVATFTPSAALAGGKIYTATVTTGVKDAAGNALASNYTWNFTTATIATTDVTAPTVQSVVPLSNATSVAINSKVTATFSEPMNSGTITTASFTLKHGTTSVAGTVAYSGNVATFTPSAALAGSTAYTATITTASKDAAGNALASNYSWNFTTITVTASDVTPPTVQSVVPLSNATSVALNSKVTATFNEAMTSATITSATFTLKQGTTSVAGTVSYSGNVATFTPSAALTGSKVYTATVTTGVKDAAGNALAANYTWNFTTVAPADVTPPTVQSVVPLNSATSVAVNSKVTATFSEPMNSGTITTSTFTLKQGTTAVAGTVSYSGNVATFTPSAALAGSKVYTATLTTGVKDVAGNALATYTWSFTTVATTTGLSFAADVIPVLGLCNNCHTHGWTTSSVASTYYTNLVNGGYVNPSAPTTSKIYSMLNSGHASSISAADRNKILTWMSEGSKNN